MNEVIIHKKDGLITNGVALSNFFNSLNDGKYLLKASSIKKRSLPQNAYYWSIVVPMVKEGLQEAGYNEVKTNEDAHEILKHLFLKKKVSSEKTGDEITISGSTAKLQTEDFNKFLEEIWQWSSEYLGKVIPEPNQQSTMFI